MSDSLFSKFSGMLLEQGIVVNVGDDLSPSQKRAFDTFKKGENILVLGEGGSGKSKLCKTICEYVKNEGSGRNIQLCSTTGISAYSINGMTIHSFMGMGTGEADIEVLVRRVKNNRDSMARLRRIDVLVIDEISMLSAELFEKINTIFQSVRNNRLFFGGVHVVFIGDLMQLLPVFTKDGCDRRLVVESLVFQNGIPSENIVCLEENFRHAGDLKFKDLLTRLRYGETTASDISLLESRMTVQPGDSIRLVSSNRKADLINKTSISGLKGAVREYKAKYTRVSGTDPKSFDLAIEELKKQFRQKATDVVSLKEGSSVMLTKNIDVLEGLVNGALGKVVRFSGNTPVVVFGKTKKEIYIAQTSWELDVNGNVAAATQIPLILAYAITIHRSQSLTLESAVMDLADAFCEHQVYVALSRVRSLEGLELISFNPRKITVNKTMLNFVRGVQGVGEQTEFEYSEVQ